MTVKIESVCKKFSSIKFLGTSSIRPYLYANPQTKEAIVNELVNPLKNNSIVKNTIVLPDKEKVYYHQLKTGELIFYQLIYNSDSSLLCVFQSIVDAKTITEIKNKHLSTEFLSNANQLAKTASNLATAYRIPLAVFAFVGGLFKVLL